MSRGSSPTSSVRTTRGGVTVVSTMLTLSERWLTTQSSLSFGAAKATGSRPTGIEKMWFGTEPSAYASTWASGVFATYNHTPLGDMAIGRTWPDSKSV